MVWLEEDGATLQTETAAMMAAATINWEEVRWRRVLSPAADDRPAERETMTGVTRHGARLAAGRSSWIGLRTDALGG